MEYQKTYTTYVPGSVLRSVIREYRSLKLRYSIQSLSALAKVPEDTTVFDPVSGWPETQSLIIALQSAEVQQWLTDMAAPDAINYTLPASRTRRTQQSEPINLLGDEFDTGLEEPQLLPASGVGALPSQSHLAQAREAARSYGGMGSNDQQRMGMALSQGAPGLSTSQRPNAPASSPDISLILTELQKVTSVMTDLTQRVSALEVAPQHPLPAGRSLSGMGGWQQNVN